MMISIVLISHSMLCLRLLLNSKLFFRHFWNYFTNFEI